MDQDAGRLPLAGFGLLQDSHTHDIGAILKESLDTEAQELALYRELVEGVAGKSGPLEEFARQMIQLEELHAADVDEMLRKPGDVASYAQVGKRASP